MEAYPCNGEGSSGPLGDQPDEPIVRGPRASSTCSKAEREELLELLDKLLQQHHDRLAKRLEQRLGLPCQGTALSAARRASVAAKPAHDGARPVRFGKESVLEMPPPELSEWRRSAVFSTPPTSEDEAEGAAGQTGAPETVVGEVSLRTSVRCSNGRGSQSSSFSKAEQVKRFKSLTAVNSDEMTGRIRASGVSRDGLAMACQVARGWVQYCTTTNWFEVTLMVLIVSSVLFCGIEVEFLAQTRRSEPQMEFYYVNFCYAVVFALELLLRLVAEGRMFFRWPNCRWNSLDSLIVLISLLEVSLSESSGGFNMQNIRVLRMVRIVRVLRIVRLMKHFRSLRILIHSVMNTMRSLFWTLVLLSVIIYAFSIVFTQATTDHAMYPGSRPLKGLEARYGSVGLSAFTLFKAISGGISWEEVVTPLSDLHGVWVLLFLIYFAFTYFAVLNVVTGVFCQTAIESAGLDQELAAQAQMAAKQDYIRKLQALFEKINVTHTGVITLAEFEERMKDEKVRAYFASIDLTVDEAFSLFKLLDQDGAHTLDIDTFVTGCLKLRGAAKVLDIAMMMYETRWKLQKCIQTVKDLEVEVQSRLPLEQAFEEGEEGEQEVEEAEFITV